MGLTCPRGISRVGPARLGQYPAILTSRLVNNAYFVARTKQRKRTRPMFRHLGRTILVNKGFIIWQQWRQQQHQQQIYTKIAGNPERVIKAHLARSSSQSQRRIYLVSRGHLYNKQGFRLFTICKNAFIINWVGISV